MFRRTLSRKLGRKRIYSIQYTPMCLFLPLLQTKVDVVNPKAISVGELYGQFNPFTMEWRDGVGSSLMRRAATKASKVFCCIGSISGYKEALSLTCRRRGLFSLGKSLGNMFLPPYCLQPF